MVEAGLAAGRVQSGIAGLGKGVQLDSDSTRGRSRGSEKIEHRAGGTTSRGPTWRTLGPSQTDPVTQAELRFDRERTKMETDLRCSLMGEPFLLAERWYEREHGSSTLLRGVQYSLPPPRLFC